MTYDRILVPEDLRRGPATRYAVNALMKACVAHLVGFINFRSAEEVAAGWKNNGDILTVIKGAASAATTSSSAALLQAVSHDFIESLGPLSAGSALLEMGLKLSFDRAASIVVPGFVADPSYLSFVGEAQPIPVRELISSSVTLTPSKLPVIIKISRELAESSNAQALVEDASTRSAALSLDAGLFDAAAAVPGVRPAGLRAGIASLPPTAGGGFNALVSDLAVLFGAVSAVASNTPPVLVVAPARAATLRLVGQTAVQPTTVLASSAIAATDVIAISPGALVSALSSPPTISVSTNATTHMADPATHISISGTPNVVAAPTTSDYQADLLSLKIRLEASWALRDSRGLAWTTGVSW